MGLAAVEERHRVTAGDRVRDDVRADESGSAEEENLEELLRLGNVRNLRGPRRGEVVVRAFLLLLRLGQERAADGQTAGERQQETASGGHRLPPVSSATMRRRKDSSGRRPNPARTSSAMWSGLEVAGIGQVMAGWPRMNLRKICAQLVQSISDAHEGSGRFAASRKSDPPSNGRSTMTPTFASAQAGRNRSSASRTPTEYGIWTKSGFSFFTIRSISSNADVV